MSRYAKNLGYVAVAPQASKGVFGVAVTDEPTGSLANNAEHDFVNAGPYDTITVTKSADDSSYAAAAEGTDYSLSDLDSTAKLKNITGGDQYFKITYTYVPYLTFVKYQGSPSMTPEIQYEQYNEGCDGQYPGITLKERHNPNGSFEALCRPRLAGLLYSLLLGDDTTTGGGAPWTHTITPADYADQPWASIERSIAGEIVERTMDARIVEIGLSGEAGKPLVMSVSYQALTSTAGHDVKTCTTEVNMPFIFWQGVYTADLADVSSEIMNFDITVTNVFDEDEQHSSLTRSDMTLIRREISVSFSYKLTDTNAANYESVYYTTGSPSTAMHTGSIKIELEYGAAAAEKTLEINVPRVVHTQRVLELDAGSDETNAFECEGHAEKHSVNPFITVIVENEDESSYV